jgi:hypothetical protein
MAWVTPKTNWSASVDADGNYAGDFFNIEDYNRIKNNISELRSMAIELYPTFGITDMGVDKSYTGYPYADEINTLTANIDMINSKTYPLNLGTRVLYYDNSKFIGFEDLNRIENACLNLYKTISAQNNSRRRLAFYLGRKERF